MVLGAFLNNTPIVAMLIPVVSAWATRIDQPRSRFMMPLSFGSMLSGTISDP
jgi:di/tricarboxylate transporter